MLIVQTGKNLLKILPDFTKQLKVEGLNEYS
jgi:hypothetical protein